MNRWLNMAAACLLAIGLLCGCENGSFRADVSGSDVGSSSEVPFISSYGGEFGSAGALDGRTLVISIFTEDSTTRWDADSEADAATIEDTLDNLRISTEYLERQVSAYGKSAEFVWDWQTFDDLRYDAVFEESLVIEYGDMYQVQRDWVRQHIDTPALKEKYRADNVVYLFFFNTDYDNQVNPWTLGYSNSLDYDVEYCNIYVKFDNYFTSPPATYAHEIMHCFGAHDLYYANEAIPSAYVDHCAETWSNDIMYTVVDSKEITNEFTELDAYYVGLVDTCETVEQWGLAPSEHLSDAA